MGRGLHLLHSDSTVSSTIVQHRPARSIDYIHAPSTPRLPPVVLPASPCLPFVVARLVACDLAAWAGRGRSRPWSLPSTAWCSSASVSVMLWTRSTVHRIYSSLPPHLQHHSTCTEAALIDFLQQQQSASIAASTTMRAPSLLTALEEDLLVEYCARAHANNASIGADVIKAQAIRMLKMRDSPVQHDGTISCTQSSRESASRRESRG
jgi:hypothetical protein